MKIEKTILRETARLAVGQGVCLILMLAVFFLLKKLDYTVVLGGLLGTLAALLNFFLLGLTMQRATGHASDPKKTVRASYPLRMLLLGAAVVLGALLPCFHVIAVVVPMVATTPILLVVQAITRAKQPTEGDADSWK